MNSFNITKPFQLKKSTISFTFMLQLIKKLFPYLSIMLIGFGVLNYSIYYGYFNIPIRHFFTASEFLLLFADDIFIYLMIWVILIALSNLFLSNTVGQQNFIEIQKQRRQPFKKRLLTFNYISIIIVIVIYLLLMFWKKDYFYNVVYGSMVAAYLIPDLLREIMYKYESVSRKEVNLMYLNLIQSTLLLCPIIAILSVYKAKNTDDGKYVGTIVTTNDTTYISTPNFFFIGKTDNYLMLHNKQDRTNIIIPNSEVKKILLKTK